MGFLNLKKNVGSRTLRKACLLFRRAGGKGEDNFFTPLESLAACSGDKGNFLMAANTGFNAPREPSR